YAAAINLNDGLTDEKPNYLNNFFVVNERNEKRGGAGPKSRPWLFVKRSWLVADPGQISAGGTATAIVFHVQLGVAVPSRSRFKSHADCAICTARNGCSASVGCNQVIARRGSRETKAGEGDGGRAHVGDGNWLRSTGRAHMDGPEIQRSR